MINAGEKSSGFKLLNGICIFIYGFIYLLIDWLICWLIYSIKNSEPEVFFCLPYFFLFSWPLTLVQVLVEYERLKAKKIISRKLTAIYANFIFFFEKNILQLLYFFWVNSILCYRIKSILSSFKWNECTTSLRLTMDLFSFSNFFFTYSNLDFVTNKRWIILLSAIWIEKKGCALSTPNVLCNLAAIKPTNAISICGLLWLHLESLRIRGRFPDSERLEKVDDLCFGSLWQLCMHMLLTKYTWLYRHGSILQWQLEKEGTVSSISNP